MTAAGFRPSAVKWHNRHPGMLAHQLREAMGTRRPVRIELRNGAVREARVVRMTRDESLKIADLLEQASNLTVHLEDGDSIKLDEIRTVSEPMKQGDTQ